MGGDAPVRRSAEQLAAIPWQLDAVVFGACSAFSAFSVVPVATRKRKQ